jgi:hypothetical protein
MADQGAKCYKCGEFGHISKDCPDTNAPGGPLGGI